ncbi:MAG: glycosyltransferase family 2 protein, partial [Bdellovibrionales bacterium]|nr:glycosyltransferase family 2 protein [Bdellovibrionales bacterium]
MSTWTAKNPFRKGRFYLLPVSDQALPLQEEWTMVSGLKRSQSLTAADFQRALHKARSGEYSAVQLPETSLLHPDFPHFVSTLHQHQLRPIVQVAASRWHRVMAGPMGDWINPERVSLNLLLDRVPPDFSLIRAWQKKDPLFHMTVIGLKNNPVFYQMDQIPREFDECLHFYFPYRSKNKFSASQIFSFGEALRKDQRDLAFKSPLGIDVYEPRIVPQMPLESEIQPVFDRCLNPRPWISVVIPVFNNPEYILNTLRHLSQQNFSAHQFQIVVVDDGSTDNTGEKILEFAKDQSLDFIYLYFPRLKPRKMGDSQFRAGLARNLGVKWARGEILSFLDSDILVPPHFLEKTLSFHQQWDIVQWRREYLHKKVDSVGAEYGQLTTKDTFIPEGGYWHRFYEEADKIGWGRIPQYWKYACTYALSIRKSHFKELGWFRKTYCFYGFEDTDLGWRAASAQSKFYLHQ